MSAWKALQHPNVCVLLGASSTPRCSPRLFIGYYPNRDLAFFLRGLPSLASVDQLEMIREIAEGVAYLHNKDILHGDLKVRGVSPAELLAIR